MLQNVEHGFSGAVGRWARRAPRRRCERASLEATANNPHSLQMRTGLRARNLGAINRG